MHQKIITEEDMMRFCYMELLKRGFYPENDELEAMADVFFDFLVDHGVIEECDPYEE